jgi:hypothetical protein
MPKRVYLDPHPFFMKCLLEGPTAGGIVKFDFPTGRVVTDDVSNNGRNDHNDVVTITPTTVLYLIRSHF